MTSGHTCRRISPANLPSAFGGHARGVPGNHFARLPRRCGLYALILKPRRSAALALRAFIQGPTVPVRALPFDPLFHIDLVDQRINAARKHYVAK